MNTNIKTIGLISLLLLLLFITITVLADVKVERIKITVSEICVEKIEEVVEEVEGVLGAYWEDDTRELEIIFEADKISFDDIERAISKAGFNTPNYQASVDDVQGIPLECRTKKAFTKEEKPSE